MSVTPIVIQSLSWLYCSATIFAQRQAIYNAIVGNLFLFFICSVLAGAVLMMGYQRWKLSVYKIRLAEQAEELMRQADREAEALKTQLLLDAKEQALEIKTKGESEIAELRRVQANREKNLDRRSEQLDLQESDLRKQQRGTETVQQRLDDRQSELNQEHEQLAEMKSQQQKLLESIAGLSREEASQQLMQSLEEELKHERGKLILRTKKQTTEAAKEQSREIILTALHRYASAFTAESTTSTIDVPNDEMKGRIIGREGRNIRAFEKATGIDLIIDDTPGVVIVSGFDPVRREIARRSMIALIADGRIHPSKIEEVVTESQAEISELILQKGREAADEVNISGLHDRVIEMLGRLHFRTSYSQNVLRHSIEVAFLSGMIAEMLGLNGDLARRCGLLHDIGKAADHELEGGHPKIGADLLQRHSESPEVVHAAFGHHDEVVTEHPYTMIVATADACSAGRPGARRESLERYIKRMEELETIAKRFQGVREAYAISAGREMRVIVDSNHTSDEQAAIICQDIAKTFEAELLYPGEIKVIVLRETVFTETAK